MSVETDVLRALLRLARRRTSPSLDQLVVRIGADEPAVRRALFSLAKSGLVQRTPAGLRLSLAGLAVAVVCAKHPRPRHLGIAQATGATDTPTTTALVLKPRGGSRERAA